MLVRFSACIKVLRPQFSTWSSWGPHEGFCCFPFLDTFRIQWSCHGFPSEVIWGPLKRKVSWKRKNYKIDTLSVFKGFFRFSCFQTLSEFREFCCFSCLKQAGLMLDQVPSELNARGVKQGLRSVPIKTVSYRRSTLPATNVMKCQKDPTYKVSFLTGGYMSMTLAPPDISPH